MLRILFYLLVQLYQLQQFYSAALSYSVSQKSSPPPKKKLFTIFSIVVYLCKWKLSWLLPKCIPTFKPILVDLSEYLYELYHFY